MYLTLSRNNTIKPPLILGVFMPETGNHRSCTANTYIIMSAKINTGKLYPIIVRTCTAVSNFENFFTAQYMPSGIVMPSAKKVTNRLRKIVFFIGSAITSVTDFL